MHDSRTRVSGDVVAEVRRHFPDAVFATVVPRNVRITEAPVVRRARDAVRPDLRRCACIHRRCEGGSCPWLNLPNAAVWAVVWPSLLGEQASVVAADESAAYARATDDVHPNPHQPRQRIDDDALRALAESIRRHGVVQPVVVRPRDAGGYELIAGERRWRAAGLAGLDQIPAIVRDADSPTRLELALVENMLREDLSPIEVAHACATLIEDFGQTHQEVAARLGRSRPAVSNLRAAARAPRGNSGHDRSRASSRRGTGARSSWRTVRGRSACWPSGRP